MKDRSIQVLLVIALTLGVVIGILEYQARHADRRQVYPAMAFLIDPSAIVSMEFKWEDSLVQCKKEDGLWLVGDSSHGMDEADLEELTKRVKDLVALKRGRTTTMRDLKSRNKTMKDYGFDAPLAEIQMVDAQGTMHRWMVGRKGKDDKAVYMKEAGAEEFYTVSVALLDALPKISKELRSHLVFPWQPDDLQQVELKRVSGPLRVVKDDAGGWDIQRPTEVLADPERFSVYAERLCQLEIEAFEAENVPDLSAYGLQEEESQQISITGPDGAMRTLVVGDAVSGKPGLIYAYRKDDTSVFLMQDEVLELINTKVGELRDVRVLTIPVDEISGVRVNSSEEMLELAKTGSDEWEITSPRQWKANPVAPEVLSLWWTETLVESFDEPLEDSVEPSSVFEFFTADGVTNRIEVFSVLRGSGQLVRLNNDSSLYLINRRVPGGFLKSLNYRDKKVWDLSRSGICKVDVERAGQVQSVRLDDAGVFVPAMTNGTYQVNSPALDDVLDCLGSLETLKYYSYKPGPLEDYGLDNPILKVTVGLSDTNELGRVLLVGNETRYGYYSMLKGRDVIFYLHPETVLILSTDMLTELKSEVSSAE